MGKLLLVLMVTAGFAVNESLHSELDSPRPLVADVVPAHLRCAQAWVSRVRESDGPNRGPQVSPWLRAVGCPPGNPWCAAFVAAMLRCGEEDGDTVDCSVRSALARNYADRKAIDARLVMRGSRDASPGDLVIWQKGSTISGHIGIVASRWKGATGWTVEGNTSSGPGGSQDDGDGVWKRRRSISPGSYFRIRWFRPIRRVNN